MREHKLLIKEGGKFVDLLPTEQDPLESVLLLKKKPSVNHVLMDEMNVRQWHEKGYQGEGMTLGVIDSIPDTSNPWFEGRVSTPLSFNTPDFETSVDPRFSHGLRVIMGVLEIVPRAHVYALPHFSEEGTTGRVVESLQWCIDNNVRVVNASIGGSNDPEVQAKAQECIDKGIFLITSAGNQGNQSGYDTLTPFARQPQWFSVGSLFFNPKDRSVSRVSSSSYGSSLDVMDVGRREGRNRAGNISRFSGTSHSAPYTSGKVLLLIEWFLGEYGRYPTRSEILDLIFDNTHYIGNQNTRTDQLGHGWFKLPRWEG